MKYNDKSEWEPHTTDSTDQRNHTLFNDIYIHVWQTALFFNYKYKYKIKLF